MINNSKLKGYLTTVYSNTNLKKEKNLKLEMETKYKITIAKLRLYTNVLVIETGRYSNSD
jgi:hypothetical protein